MTDSTTPSRPTRESSREYMVVARRYRPQRFEELVGQDQVSVALRNAIATNRVGHAYLFTGARGVGKTSTARILAKALNCVTGPSGTPCNECDVCQGVASGEDVDVLEIDGASNRGIDEIRQLRANINVRPSRARFKIYIIDEVHMLTKEAFNALLKTLEEPPQHVKFIFCTTDVEKIPITVRSRCQRFDFPPVDPRSILDRLQVIVQAEGAHAEPEALTLLARRAAGSMRDSQSLLEQLLAFSGNEITVDSVHRMLGTARSGNVSQLVTAITQRNAPLTMRMVEDAIRDGVDAGQLAEQLLGYFRDMMAAHVGCNADLMLHTLPADFPEIVTAGKHLGLETLLAMVQILDQAVVKMRHSMHARIILEVALVRLCNLEALQDLATLISQFEHSGPLSPSAATAPASPALRPPGSTTSPASTSRPAPVSTQARPAPPATSATPASPPPASITPSSSSSSTGGPASASAEAEAQKKNDLTETLSAADSISSAPSQDASSQPLTTTATTTTTANSITSGFQARTYWEDSLKLLDDLTADYARFFSDVAISAPDRLVIRFPAEYTLQKEACERPDRRQKLVQALAQVVGREIGLSFELLAARAPAADERRSPASRRQRMRELESHPLVQETRKLFEAEVVEVSEVRRAEG